MNIRTNNSSFCIYLIKSNFDWLLALKENIPIELKAHEYRSYSDDRSLWGKCNQN